MQLVWPAAEHLGAYIAALESGWSADNVRGAVAAREELERIRRDEASFLAGMVDREARGEPVTLPDGSEANGGVLVERFVKPAQYGSTPGLRYRIALGAHTG